MIRLGVMPAFTETFSGMLDQLCNSPESGTVTEDGVVYKFAGWQTEDGTAWNDVVLKEDTVMKASWKRIVDNIHVTFQVPAVGETIQEPVIEEDDLLCFSYWYVVDDSWDEIEAIEKTGSYNFTCTVALNDPENLEFALENDEYDLLNYTGKAYLNGIEAEYVEYDEDENFLRIEYEFEAAEAEPEYTAEKGNGETWTKGSEDGMTIVFRCNIHDEDTFSKFRNITIDGTLLLRQCMQKRQAVSY